MTILNIETSTSACSVAITMDGQAVAVRGKSEGANHASDLPLFIDELIAQAKQEGWTIEAVALSQGPGSYTGLRIGASIAKGLCYGWKVPLIPLDTLQIICAMVDRSALPTNSVLCPMIDARRMEVYTAMYDPTDLHPLSEICAQIVDETSFTESQTHLYYFGNGAAKCQEVITQPNAHFIDGIIPHAQYMGQLAEQYIHQQLDEKQLAYFEPFYLKEFVAAPSKIKGLK